MRMGGLAASVMLVATQAFAQEDARPWETEIHRTWGLGAALGAGGGAFRIPGELGLELLTTGQHFGFQILARPWVEFGGVSGSGQSASAVAGGVVGMLAFVGYFTNE